MKHHSSGFMLIEFLCYFLISTIIIMLVMQFFGASAVRLSNRSRLYDRYINLEQAANLIADDIACADTRPIASETEENRLTIIKQTIPSSWWVQKERLYHKYSGKRACIVATGISSLVLTVNYETIFGQKFIRSIHFKLTGNLAQGETATMHRTVQLRNRYVT